MTSEELIVLMDGLQLQLPKCAIQVLLRLVAKCIVSGTNTIEISARDLADELAISRDAVKVAARALAPLIIARNDHGVAMRWTLPPEWFVVQRSLFAVPSLVDNPAQWQSNQATVAWKPGHAVDDKPGQSGLETRPLGRVTRPQWTSYQATSGLETRPYEPQSVENTEPPGLETRPPSIDRDRDLSSGVVLTAIRDSIEGVNWLPEVLRDDGAQLKRWLRFFFAQTRPNVPVPDGPDEIIQAKCLAIASLSRLQHVLSQMHKKKTRAGDTWAWWVTTFCQRVHGTKNMASVRAPEGFRQPKKNPSTESGASFRTDLMQEITASAGRLH